MSNLYKTIQAGAYDVFIMWGCNRVGLMMMKNDQLVKGHGKEFGYYPGNTDNPVRVFLN